MAKARAAARKAAEPKWLDRSLIIGPYITLCTTEEQFEAVLEQLDVEKSVPLLGSPQANATVHRFEREGGDMIFAVCLGPTEGRTGIQIAALLLHEAVHIWQAFREHIGEREPSNEFEAYSIQRIAQSLMESYAESITKSPDSRVETEC